MSTCSLRSWADKRAAQNSRPRVSPWAVAVLGVAGKTPTGTAVALGPLSVALRIRNGSACDEPIGGEMHATAG